MAVSMSYFKPSVMFFHRRLLIRASLFLNFCVLTYVALQAAQNSGSGGRTVRSGLSDNFNLPSGVQIVYNNVEKSQTESFSRDNSMSTNLAISSLPAQLSTEMEMETSSISTGDQQLTNNIMMAESTEQTHLSEFRIVDCQDRDNRFSYSQRGSYWILNHYIPSERNYHCDESVTYTTHGDVSFLDNIIPLARRWDGPLSVAVYTPGSDYEVAVQSIAYLRQCTEPDIRQKVTFHLVLDERHFPSSLRKLHPQQGSPTTIRPQTQPSFSASTSTPDLQMASQDLKPVVKVNNIFL